MTGNHLTLTSSAIAGVILFFTCAGAALAPLAMGRPQATGSGGLRTGFVLATVWAVLLFLGLLFNWIANPAREVLLWSDRSEYGSWETDGCLQVNPRRP